MLATSDLTNFIQRNEIKAELIQLSTGTQTVAAAAKALGVPQDLILKSVLFLVDDRPVLVIGRGPERIDRKPIAAYYNVGKKRISLADPAVVHATTGFSVGSLPPFGHRLTLETLIDETVLQTQEIYAGGGAIDTLMRVSTEDLLRVTQAISLPLQGLIPPSARVTD